MLLLICAWLVLPAGSAAAAGTEAVRGTLDLSDGTLERDGWVPLNGEWGFYWQRLLEPGELDAPGAPVPAHATVPEIWSNLPWDGGELEDQGFATYRLIVRLAEADRERTLALYMPSVATAYKLFVDGAPLGGNGVVGASAAEMTPKNVPKVYFFTPQGDSADIVVQVSNFVQRKGGLWEEIRFGRADAIGALRNANVMREAAVLAGIVLMAIYHLGLFAYRRTDLAPLFFAGLCFAVAARMLFLGETLAVYAIPAIPWEAGVKVEYIAVCVGFTLWLLFTRSQYPDESHRAATIYSLLVTGSVVAFVSATPAAVYTEYFLGIILVGALPTLLYILYVYAAAAIRRRQGSLLNGVGFVLFGVTIANDVLFYTQWVNEGNFIPFGLLAALFTQSLNVAGRFSHAFRRSERLGAELRRMNELLEVRVAERTAALRETNDRLEERNVELSTLEQSRRQLMSTISHELGTPLTSIQGYLKLMIDGIIPGKDENVLRLIYDKTLFLDRIIQDLFDLSKLEARQLRFQFHTVDAASFLRQLSDGYEWSEAGSGVRVHVRAWEPERDDWLLRIDPIRIEQVLANLVANAKKFTPSGGRVAIGFETTAMPGTGAPAVKVEVTDNGVGIPEAELPHVFDRFYKGSSAANARLDGAGLGLAIAKHIVEQHEGRIGVDSAPSRGSAFYFLLPIQTGGRP
jgi:signal transduction histidine kinase